MIVYFDFNIVLMNQSNIISYGILLTNFNIQLTIQLIYPHCTSISFGNSKQP